MLDQLVAYVERPEALISFLTLTLLEIVLGIDNVIFLAIVANRLDGRDRGKARFVGLMLALVMRVVFLASVVWLTHLTTTAFAAYGYVFSWRDSIFLAGGLFLVAKATLEISAEVNPRPKGRRMSGAAAFGLVVVQIVALDLVFSIDSVMTAVGLSRELPIMIAAIVISIFVMLVASDPVGAFIMRHPSVKMLALAFLLLIGTALIADGFGVHFDRNYLYAAIAFSLLVEMLNMLVRASEKRREAPNETGARHD
jgi:predicted tellurium resistance membrane protein TerC